jgi:hypothetical protein
MVHGGEVAAGAAPLGVRRCECLMVGATRRGGPGHVCGVPATRYVIAGRIKVYCCLRHRHRVMAELHRRRAGTVVDLPLRASKVEA